MWIRVLCVITLLCIHHVSAWHNIEHATIAQIAKNYAQKLSYEKVVSVVEYIGSKYPGTEEYLEASCWPDEVKEREEFKHTTSWHFIRNPYSADETKTIEDSNKETIVTELLRLKREIDEDTINEETSQNLRFLMHLIGDIHQPLHTFNYFDKQFPKGDENGKQFNIQLANNTTPLVVDLHFYTDACAGLFSDDIHLPFTDERYDEIVNRAKEIAGDCEDVYLSGFEFDPVAWAQESYEAAIEIYKSVSYMNILSDEQVEHIQSVLRKQMCKAGKRLGVTYSLIYSKFPPPSDFYLIMVLFVTLLAIVVLDELYYGSSCSKQRKEYVGIENNKRKVKFDFGNSKLYPVCSTNNRTG